MKIRPCIIILVLMLMLGGCADLNKSNSSAESFDRDFQPISLQINGGIESYVSSEYAKKIWDEAICTAIYVENQSMTGAYTLYLLEAPGESRKEYTILVSSDLNLIQYNGGCYRLTESGKVCLHYLIDVSEWIPETAEAFSWQEDDSVKIIASYEDFAIGVLEDQPDIRIKLRSSGELSTIVGKTIVLTAYDDVRKEGDRIEIVSDTFIAPEELVLNTEAVNQTEEG